MIFSGKVIKGDGRGKKLGYPTANLEVINASNLPQGIFAAWTSVDDKCYPSALFVGIREMFGDSKISVEVHIIEFDNDLYHRELKVEIIKFIRKNNKFKTTSNLTKQIDIDIKQIIKILT